MCSRRRAETKRPAHSKSICTHGHSAVFCEQIMKIPLLRKTLVLTLASALVSLGGVSCMTTYDAYGRPVQSVDPGAAAVGIAAAGVLGYALANDHHSHHHYHGHYHRPYAYRPYSYRPPCRY
jgi:hypothetical protein